jgi:cytoskeletal protein RodZ
MARVGLLGIVLAFVTTAFAAATPAFAATQNLSGTVTATINQVGTSYTDDSSTNSGNVTGAADSAYLTLTHSSGNVLATWTISASLGSGLTDIGATFTFYKDAASNMGVSSMSQIVLTDSNGNTATLGTSLSMSSGSGPYTISTVFSAYTLNNINGTFTASNVNAVAFTFSVGASGSKTFGLDAVDVVDTPEPSAIALFSLGLAGLGGGLWRRRRARRAAAERPAS